MRTIAQRLRHLALAPRQGPSQHAVAGVHRRLGRTQDARLSDAARRRLDQATSNAERFVALQDDDVHGYLADGTLVMGRHSYAAPRVRKYKGDTNRVIVGDFCSLAPDADFYVGGRHPIDWVSCYGLREMFDLPGAYEGPMPHSKGDIVVGSDCWITDGATVVSGVSIGHGAVVGTKAVVAKDVRPYAIVVGNPAREIGRRFSDEQVEALLRIRWWDWDLDDVLARVEDLNGASIDAFIEQYDPGSST